MGRMPDESSPAGTGRASPLWGCLVTAAALCGLLLIADTVGRSSATYDEVTYLRVAARWWRTGEQDEITRMGSPLTFWKLQQAPVFWLIDRLGRGELVDDPIRHQAALLPLVRAGALWIWPVAFGLATWWARLLYGPRAMALAAWLFALSPNLIAHAGLATMELPLTACTTGMFFSFWQFRRGGRWGWLWLSAAVGGLAFSCKYTAVLIPPILTLAWLAEGLRAGWTARGDLLRKVILGMAGYGLIMALSNLVFTGFATLPLSRGQGAHPSIPTRFGERVGSWIGRIYETPLPQDWTGFAIQAHHQKSGGSSYLLGERRMRGWAYYYFIALAAKLPLACWLLLFGRAALELMESGEGRDRLERHDGLLVLAMALFLAITAAGSARNYGLRYLLPLTPLAVVWISRLGEGAGPRGRACCAGWPGWVAAVGLLGQAGAVASCHPFELTFFNRLAGGSLGGRRILADSNLDWGQGLRGLARLQRAEPRFRDLTLYYFGDTEPAHYGVQGQAYVVGAIGDQVALPGIRQVRTRYLAVSASLQWGPWGPPGFFRALDGIPPECYSEDTSIAIYRTSDLGTSLARTPSG